MGFTFPPALIDVLYSDTPNSWYPATEEERWDLGESGLLKLAWAVSLNAVAESRVTLVKIWLWLALLDS